MDGHRAPVPGATPPTPPGTTLPSTTPPSTTPASAIPRASGGGAGGGMGGADGGGGGGAAAGAAAGAGAGVRAGPDRDKEVQAEVVNYMAAQAVAAAKAAVEAASAAGSGDADLRRRRGSWNAIKQAMEAPAGSSVPGRPPSLLVCGESTWADVAAGRPASVQASGRARDARRPSVAAIREGVLRCVGNCPRASGCDYCAQRAQLLGWRDHMLDLMRRDLQAEAEAKAGAEAK